MAKYEVKDPLDYSSGGDRIDDFAQKYKNEIDQIYKLLNALRTRSEDNVEPEPNQLRINNCALYIRNQSNTEWIKLGDFKPFWGFKTSNDEEFILTSDVTKEQAKKLNDIDTSKLVNTDNLSQTKIDQINALNLLMVLTQDHLNLTKISQLNSLDLLKVITTDSLSNDKIADVNNLDFSKVLTQANLSLKKIAEINALDVPNVITQKNVTIAKLEQLNALDLLKVVTLNHLPAGKINDINSLDFQKVITQDDVATGELQAGKLYKSNANGMLPVSITGNAAKIGNISIALKGAPVDGQVLVYRASTNTWEAENKGDGVGVGKSITIRRGNKIVCEYDGTEHKEIDLIGEDDCVKKNPDGSISLTEVPTESSYVKFRKNPDGSLTPMPREFYTSKMKYDAEGNIVVTG